VDLAKLVRTGRNLERAWRHVEMRAHSSNDKDTQTALAKIRENPSRAIRDIQRGLTKGAFEFQPQKGVLKKRSGGKRPRPIVVAPIVNRIVQRAILDICQSDNPSVRRGLGNVPAVIDCPTSVGGLPGRGVPEAIAQIQQAISGGAIWYVRSDLQDFFRHIPKPKIQAFLETNVTDAAFVALFMRALETELANPDAVRAELDLFPMGDEGVPQGSALSALCANIVLAEFDRKLNDRGVTTIRYLDDFVIMASNKKAVEKAWEAGLKILGDLGLEAHDPALGNGKAAKGLIADGFDFLSFRIDLQTVAPSSKARAKVIDDVKTVIRKAKADITDAGKEPRRAQSMFLQSLVRLDRKIRGWGDAFSATTQRLAFAQLDAEIDKLVENYRLWFGRHVKGLGPTATRRKYGIALLADTPLQ
jgi:RNA-directed DNA polymerase